jgi:hypothetical protein
VETYEKFMKPHRYKKDERTDGLCACWAAANHRLHQPWWWRALHPHKNWRT